MIGYKLKVTVTLTVHLQLQHADDNNISAFADTKIMNNFRNKNLHVLSLSVEKYANIFVVDGTRWSAVRYN